MIIEKKTEGSVIILHLSGRLDSNTAPEFEAAVDQVLSETTELIFDFADLAYISSAGLRIILKAHKEMIKKGTFKLKHVCDAVMDVLDVSGFADILTIE